MMLSDYKEVQLDGDILRVLSVGAERNGKTYCHLASTTRGFQQPNGLNPLQMVDWVPSELLEKRVD